jgi:hypothetical protein
MDEEANSDPTCTPCPGGYYCDEKALTTAELILRGKYCDPGYYCTAGAETPYPTDGVKGDICPAGHYCEGGNIEAAACDPGTYESRLGSYECQDCPEGFYCEQATEEPIICVNGFCPEKSAAPSLCLDGTYANETTTQLVSSDDCHVCPNGVFCKDGYVGGVIGTAIDSQAALCDPGYFCDYGATSARDYEKICPIGHYCPRGTPLPIRCDLGLYNS